jgi:hypothetical protein
VAAHYAANNRYTSKIFNFCAVMTIAGQPAVCLEPEPNQAVSRYL